jgi:RimJ/RimL family protein N-acetyltransferase
MREYSFHISRDADAIKDCIKLPHNAIHQFVNGADSDTWEPSFGGKYVYIAIREGMKLHGFFILIQTSCKSAEAHMIFNRSAYGKTIDMGRQCIKWLRDRFPGLGILMAPVSEENKLALRCVKGMGFEDEGITQDGYRQLKAIILRGDTTWVG